MNFLEQLVAEWYEFNGYFVRRNVKVGPRAKGGHDGELDVVAFHPGRKSLVLACTRFQRHRVRCFDGTGGVSWRGGSLRGSSSLRLYG